MAGTARSRIYVRPSKSSMRPSRKNALKKIARILEDQMTDMGLSEEEKNAKTAELVAFVSDVAASKLELRSKRSKPPYSAAARA